MAYGTSMEQNAVATLTNVVMPILDIFDGLVYVEEGLYFDVFIS